VSGNTVLGIGRTTPAEIPSIIISLRIFLFSGFPEITSSNITPWKLVSFRNTSKPACSDSMAETNDTREQSQVRNYKMPFKNLRLDFNYKCVAIAEQIASEIFKRFRYFENFLSSTVQKKVKKHWSKP
jgi:hypothetical protein